MRPWTRRARALTIPLAAVPVAGVCAATDAGEQASSSALPDRPVTDVDIHGILEKRVAMIPMRDGARLHTEIHVPRDVDEPLPFIVERTPYGLDHAAGAQAGRERRGLAPLEHVRLERT